MKFLPLLATIIVTWIVHVVLVTGYMKLFTNTHVLLFRLVYAIELTITFSLGVWLYYNYAKQPLSMAIVLASVIIYLCAVDTILSMTVKSVRDQFDILHFAVAYTSLGVCIFLLFKGRR